MFLDIEKEGTTADRAFLSDAVLTLNQRHFIRPLLSSHAFVSTSPSPSSLHPSDLCDIFSDLSLLAAWHRPSSSTCHPTCSTHTKVRPLFPTLVTHALTDASFVVLTSRKYGVATVW